MPLRLIYIASFFLFLSSCFFLGGGSQDTSMSGEGENIPQNEQIQIFALGDSLTAGYGLPLEDSYPFLLQERLRDTGYNHNVINAGVSGNTSSELKGRLDWVLTDARAGDIALLVIGGNDGLRGMSLSDLENNIEEMIEKIRSRDMRIVLGGMQIPPNLGLKYTGDFESLYRNIAHNNTDIYFIDFFLEGVAGVRSLNLPDGIHPTREGYEIITENIYNFLLDNTLLGLR